MPRPDVRDLPRRARGDSSGYGRKLVLDVLVRGARGYISKTLGGRAIFSALQLVLVGKKFVLSIILDDDEQSRAGRLGNGDVPVDNPIHQLTRRERDVLIGLPP